MYDLCSKSTSSIPKWKLFLRGDLPLPKFPSGRGNPCSSLLMLTFTRPALECCTASNSGNFSSVAMAARRRSACGHVENWETNDWGSPFLVTMATDAHSGYSCLVKNSYKCCKMKNRLTSRLHWVKNLGYDLVAAKWKKINKGDSYIQQVYLSNSEGVARCFFTPNGGGNPDINHQGCVQDKRLPLSKWEVIQNSFLKMAMRVPSWKINLCISNNYIIIN